MSNCGLWRLHEERLPIEVFDRSKLYFAAWGFSIEHAQELAAKGFEVDYVEDRYGRRLAAAKLGGVRLIDNIAIEKERGIS